MLTQPIEINQRNTNIPAYRLVPVNQHTLKILAQYYNLVLDKKSHTWVSATDHDNKLQVKHGDVLVYDLALEKSDPKSMFCLHDSEPDKFIADKAKNGLRPTNEFTLQAAIDRIMGGQKKYHALVLGQDEIIVYQKNPWRILAYLTESGFGRYDNDTITELNASEWTNAQHNVQLLSQWLNRE